jgi:hypothetical protein
VSIETIERKDHPCEGYKLSHAGWVKGEDRENFEQPEGETTFPSGQPRRTHQHGDKHQIQSHAADKHYSHIECNALAFAPTSIMQTIY